MKFPLHLLLTASTPICSAYVHPSSLVVHHPRQRHQPCQRHNARSTCLYYKEPSTNAEDSDSSSSANVWSVLGELYVFCMYCMLTYVYVVGVMFGVVHSPMTHVIAKSK